MAKDRSKHAWGQFFSTALGVAVGAGTFYALVIRPWHLKWGSSEVEVKRSLPGDEIVANPMMQATRSISIQAAPAQIWPWLVQMGYKRAGWYSYDELETAVGVGDFHDGSSAERIIPELQNLKVGDLVPVADDDMGWFVVDQIQPERALVLRATINPLTGQAFQGEVSEPWLDASWTFFLDEAAPAGGTAALDEPPTRETRLSARFRATYAPKWMAAFVYGVLEPVHFLMERKMLEGIQARVEGPQVESITVEDE
jgi:hypothetical protein